MQSDDETNFKPANVYDIMTKSDAQIVEQFGGNTMTKDQELIGGDNDIQGRPSLFHRMFSNMEAGSLRGSIFAMSSLALGTGCLALPQKFEQMSLLVSLSMILISSAAAYWSLLLMIKASNAVQAYDYSKLVKQVFGNKISLTLDIIILVYIFGIIISYQCISKIF